MVLAGRMWSVMRIEQLELHVALIGSSGTWGSFSVGSRCSQYLACALLDILTGPNVQDAELSPVKA